METSTATIVVNLVRMAWWSGAWSGLVSRTAVPCEQVLYLDEPSTGLDPETRQELWKIVRLRSADNLGDT